jgi:hypothetical protein
MATLCHQPTTKGTDGLHQAATDGVRRRNNKFNASEHEDMHARTHDGDTKSNTRARRLAVTIKKTSLQTAISPLA